MKPLELFVVLTLMLASTDAVRVRHPARTPSPAPAPFSGSSNSSSPPPAVVGDSINTTLTTAMIESSWVLYTGSALSGFGTVVFTKPDSDPSNRCYLTGYYDPTARNATTAVNCFLDLQALVVYSFQQGLRIYYTGTMYIAGPDGPENDCSVICRSYNSTMSSAAAPLRGTAFYGHSSLPWIMIVITALVLDFISRSIIIFEASFDTGDHEAISSSSKLASFSKVTGDALHLLLPEEDSENKSVWFASVS
ncbi:hypothetical protein R1sor_015376 [Riccia sorocarpa]|uniref:Membrane-associated protein n=1 Tax=Riccia sorocarpa TaxID=122646 RepID=A0ABD3HF28_9MARC